MKGEKKHKKKKKEKKRNPFSWTKEVFPTVHLFFIAFG